MKRYFINAFPPGKAPGFTAVFTSRQKGVSKGAYKSLNLGTQTGDSKKNVRENLQILKKNLKAPGLITLNQVHGVRVVSALRSGVKADGAVTNVPGRAVAVKTADCAGIIIYDEKNRAFAVVHAGWRGMAGFIAHEAVEVMKKKYGSVPSCLRASVSPAIGVCCYEVGEELYNSLKRTPEFSNIFIRRGAKIFMDLKKGVKNTLASSGIKKSRIYVSRLCTSCEEELFFSHRRDKGVTGRCASAAVINKAEKCTKKR